MWCHTTIYYRNLFLQICTYREPSMLPLCMYLRRRMIVWPILSFGQCPTIDKLQPCKRMLGIHLALEWLETPLLVRYPTTTVFLILWNVALPTQHWSICLERPEITSKLLAICFICDPLSIVNYIAIVPISLIRSVSCLLSVDLPHFSETPKDIYIGLYRAFCSTVTFSVIL